jgi:serine/threonine protein kinase/predicted ATPase
MAESPPNLPSKIADFEILRRLGKGGMAEVFLACKRGAEETAKTLVVKRILPSYGSSRRFRGMFIDEAKLATRLNHPNVVQVYEFFEVPQEGHVLAMEYVEGPDLGQVLSQARKVQSAFEQGSNRPFASAALDPYLVAWIVAEVAKGLHYAHERKDDQGHPLQIVHRDVSPSNVLLSFEGAVKIADFGIASARFTEDEAGVIKGKFGYMSPEQARGEKVDRRSDLYSLGVLFWEALTLQPLHAGLGGEALLDIVRSGVIEPPSRIRPEIPEAIEAVVLKLLQKNPDDRFLNGRKLVEALNRLLLEHQEMIDSLRLEETLADLFPAASRVRDEALHLVGAGDVESPRTVADRKARDANKSIAAASIAGPEPGREHEKERGERPEVRHVVVVRLRLHPRAGLSGGNLERQLAPLKRMLGEMAFKYRMRWHWDGACDATAIAGTAAKHARAPFEAAMLAKEAQEAILAASDGDDPLFSASLALVRATATGPRDKNGHLVRFAMPESAHWLGALLLDQTPPGKTFVAGGLQRILRRDFLWGDERILDVDDTRGAQLPPELRVHELVRALSAEERARIAATSGSDLVGRDGARADLVSAFHAATSRGRGQLVLRAVTGELGIGKSALVQAFLNEIREPHRVLRAEASPVSTENPYATAIELVRDTLGLDGNESVDEVARSIVALGTRELENHPAIHKLAELAARKNSGDEDDGESFKKLVVHGLRSFLIALCGRDPVVFVLESFQWIDRQSWEAFSAIFAEPFPFALFVLLVTRTDERAPTLPAAAIPIPLDSLDEDEQVRLVENRLGLKRGVSEIVREIGARVGGNPFFLLEMIDAMLERGTLRLVNRSASDGTSAGAEDGEPELVRKEGAGDLFDLPSTLEQLVADRILELPEDERAIVHWLAVAGGALTADELSALAGADAESCAARLCTRGLCDARSHGRSRVLDAVDFRHPLTRDVAYAGLDRVRKVRMHAAVGQLFARGARKDLGPAIVARHLEKGELRETAAHFYIEAAQAARNDHELPLATRYFQKALVALPAGDTRRFVCLEALDMLFRHTGKKKERIRVLMELKRSAKVAGTARPVAGALLHIARFELDDARLEQGLPRALRAASLASKAELVNLAIEAEALSSEFLRELGDVQGALAACDRALSASDPKMGRHIPPRTRAEVLVNRGVLLRRVGRVREAVDAYADAIAYAKIANARRLEARIRNALAFAMWVQGRYEDALALGQQSLTLDLSIGARFALAKTITNLAVAFARLGDLPTARAHLQRAGELHERYGDEESRADYMIVLAEISLEYGDLDEARTVVDEALALATAARNAYDSTHAKLVRAALHLAERQPRRAAELALEARHEAESQALVAYMYYAMALEASARVEIGEVHIATLLGTMALGGVETVQGCEYGLEIRLLCADALKRAGSPQAPTARQRAVDYATALSNEIRDPRFRRLFSMRPPILALFDSTPAPGVERSLYLLDGAASDGSVL